MRDFQAVKGDVPKDEDEDESVPCSHSDGDGDENDDSDDEVQGKKVHHHELVPQTRPLPESIYGAAMVSILRTIGSDHKMHFASPAVFLVLVLNLFLQGYVLYAVKIWVCSPMVLQARKLYDQFEAACFYDDVYNQALFDAWDPEKKDKLCRVPLSEPPFFLVILMIWTAQIMSDLNETFSYTMYWLNLPAPDEGDVAETNVDEDGSEVQIVKAGKTMKAMVICFIMIPKAVIAVVLWWLGARWLTATLSFQDVIINAMALAFITDLDEVVYTALLPNEYKDISMLYTIHVPWRKREGSSALWKNRNTLITLFKVAICTIIPYLYISYFQQVLPEYHWDVSGPCQEYFAFVASQEDAYIPMDEGGAKGGRR